MISQYYPHPDSVKEEPASVYNPNSTIAVRAKKHQITVAEWHRRDKIIVDLYRHCPYNIGDICIPVDPRGVTKYGAVVVQNILKSYMEVSAEDEWPKNDNPFLITAIPEDTEKHGTTVFFCTTNYLEKIK